MWLLLKLPPALILLLVAFVEVVVELSLQVRDDDVGDLGWLRLGHFVLPVGPVVLQEHIVLFKLLLLGPLLSLNIHFHTSLLGQSLSCLQVHSLIVTRS